MGAEPVRCGRVPSLNGSGSSLQAGRSSVGDVMGELVEAAPVRGVEAGARGGCSSSRTRCTASSLAAGTSATVTSLSDC